jgi:PPP family 3-phenylpropionic acid transporter
MAFLSSTGERVATVYGALFFGFGIYLPFYPLLLADRGMGDTEIAMLIAVPMALRAVLASPLGILADWIGNRRHVLMLYSLIAALAFSAFFFSYGFFALMAVSIATTMFSNASTPVTDAIATSIVRRGEGDYGRMRMWGSLSFVLANVVGGGMVAGLSVHVLFWVLLVALWGAFVVLCIAPPSGFDHTPETSRPVQPDDLEVRTIRPHFLKDRVLMAGMMATALIQASHAMVYGFSSLYWGEIGFSGTIVGIFWATGVISETLMFFFSGRLLSGLGPGQMLLISGTAATVRWLLFPVLTSIPSYLVMQSLHSLSFACGHLALMRLIVMRVPDRSAATVQGLYVTVGALTMSAATVVAGSLYRVFHGHGFQIMSVFAISGLVAAVIWVGLKRQVAFELH